MKNKKVVIIIAVVIFAVCFVLMLLASIISDLLEEKETNTRYDELSYEVPSKFKGSSHYYSYYEDSVSCHIDFDAYEKNSYESPKKVLEDNVYFQLDDEVSDLKEEEFNGIKMYYVSKKNSASEEYYYAFESTNYIYSFEYDISDYLHGDREDSENNICYTAMDKIISSIKVK